VNRQLYDCIEVIGEKIAESIGIPDHTAYDCVIDAFIYLEDMGHAVDRKKLSYKAFQLGINARRMINRRIQFIEGKPGYAVHHDYTHREFECYDWLKNACDSLHLTHYQTELVAAYALRDYDLDQLREICPVVHKNHRRRHPRVSTGEKLLQALRKLRTLDIEVLMQLYENRVELPRYSLDG